MSEKYIAGQEITADEANRMRRGGSTVEGLNAGETINGATLPVPTYQNTSDNEFYACDGNDTSKLKYVGFAITNSTDGNSIEIQFEGIVKGFSGLAEGEKYYLQDAVGTIGLSKGTYEVLVGIAISTTELLIVKGELYEVEASDNLRASADTERQSASTTYVKIKEFEYLDADGTIRVKFDLRRYAGEGGVTTVYGRIYKNGVAHGTEQTHNTNSYVTKSEDLSFETGDTIELWVKSSDVPVAYGPQVRNFRLYYDKVLKEIPTTVVTD